MPFPATKRSVCTSCGSTVRRGDFVEFARSLGAWHVTCPAPKARPNERSGSCEICRVAVPKLKGTLAPVEGGDGYRIRCREHGQ